MSETNNDGKQVDVVKKLNEIIINDDDFADLIQFLDQQGRDSTYINTLYALLDNDRRFRVMTERYLQESRSATVSNSTLINQSSIKNKEQEFESNISQLPMVVVPGAKSDCLHSYKADGVGIVNLVQGIRAIPPERQAIIISKIMTTVNSVVGEGSIVATSTSRALTQAQVIAGKVVPVVIVAVQLSWEALKSIRSWWNGEISGARCVKQIIDGSAGVLGGFGGGAAGCALGSLILPGYGALIGAVAGGLAGSAALSALSEWLTSNLFNLPKSVAVENAYRFLNLPISCSNGEINTKYRTLALTYHPDKGGNAEDFHKLQIAVAIIKQSRGQGV